MSLQETPDNLFNASSQKSLAACADSRYESSGSASQRSLLGMDTGGMLPQSRLSKNMSKAGFSCSALFWAHTVAEKLKHMPSAKLHAIPQGWIKCKVGEIVFIENPFISGIRVWPLFPGVYQEKNSDIIYVQNNNSPSCASLLRG